jgi:putative hemin transport protein
MNQFEIVPVPFAPRPDDDVDVSALRRAWLAMKSAQDFDRLLERFQITEIQAVRLVGRELAFRVQIGTVENVLGACVDYRLPITIVVGHGRGRRTQTARIIRVDRSGKSLTLTSAKGFIEIRDDLADSVWIVRRPIAKGVLTRLELYSVDGSQIATVCGAREESARVAWAILISAFSEGATG